MCFKGKCLYCLEVETGALIYAIINLMLTALGCVIAIGWLFHPEAASREIFAPVVHKYGYTTNVIIPFFVASCCISFVFAVLLIVGICKRNANYVKVFFVYGVVKVVLAVIVSILLILEGQSQRCAAILITSLIVTLMLIMVRLTYKKFEQEVAYLQFNNLSNPLSVITK